MSGSNIWSGGASSPFGGPVETLQWSELTDTSQSYMGGERSAHPSANRLCHIRSSIEGHSCSTPRQVTMSGGVCREKVCLAAHILNASEHVNWLKPTGNQEGE